MPAPTLGQEFPDFEAESSKGPFKLSEWAKGSWAMLCSHPADFTPVCTTELGKMAEYAGEFAARGVKIAAISCDDAETHKKWIPDIIAYNPKLEGDDISYPIIADPKREIAVALGMLDPVEKDAAGLPLSARAVFIINPAGKLALSILYPATTGRNFDEILRVIDSLKLTVEHKCATPVNWSTGKDCMVVPSVSDEEAAQKFPKGFTKATLPSGKGYVRTTPDPRV